MEEDFKEKIAFISVIFAFLFVGYIFQSTIQSQFEYGCTKAAKDLEFPLGQRVYSPSNRLYGVVDDLNQDCSVLGINWDNTRISQQGVTDYIKVTNGIYLNLTEYPNDGIPPEDPCENPKSEAVAKACILIMEARFGNR